MSEINHAWFSYKQLETLKKLDIHVSVYETEDGRHILVTEVLSTESTGSCFSDAIYLGKVIKWVRSATPDEIMIASRRYNSLDLSDMPDLVDDLLD